MLEANLIGPLKLDNSQINFKLPSLFVDGGNRNIHLFQNIIDEIGDNDSTTGRSPQILLEQKKDESDYYHGLLELIPHYDKIHLHGFYGERDDHQLAIYGDSISILNKYSDKLICLYRQNNKSIIISSHSQYSYQIKDGFSLFSLEEQKITILGSQYPIIRKSFKISPLSSKGLSNIALKVPEIRCSKPIILIPYDL